MRVDFPVCAPHHLRRDVDYQQPFIPSCLSWQFIWWQRSKFEFCSRAARPSALIGFGKPRYITPTFPPLHPCDLTKTATGKSQTAGSLTPSRLMEVFHLSPHLMESVSCDDQEAKLLASKHTGQECFHRLGYTSKHTLLVFTVFVKTGWDFFMFYHPLELVDWTWMHGRNSDCLSSASGGPARWCNCFNSTTSRRQLSSPV